MTSIRVFHEKEIGLISVRLSDRSAVIQHKIICFMHHFTCWTSFISRIIRVCLNDSHPQPNSDLAQLAEHETDDPGVVSSNPTKFILFCVTLDLSDNLTEMRIMKNSIGSLPFLMVVCWSVSSGRENVPEVVFLSKKQNKTKTPYFAKQTRYFLSRSLGIS